MAPPSHDKLYEVSFSQNVTFDRVSREIEDFLKGKQEEI
jgi:hypothetical protein